MDQPTPVPTPRPKVRLGPLEFGLIALLVLALGVMFSGQLPGRAPETTLGPAVASTDLRPIGHLPRVDLTTLDGKPLTSADLDGKVVVLHFWGTRCGPCLQELPSLREEYRGKLGNDERVLLVALASDTDRATVERFVKSRGVPFPVVVSDSPAAVAVWQQLGVEYTPATIIANPNGEMLWAGEKVPRNIVEIVDQLAKG